MTANDNINDLRAACRVAFDCADEIARKGGTPAQVKSEFACWLDEELNERRKVGQRN